MITIGKRKIGKQYKPLVIAEIGINHDGDFNRAKRMVKAAHDFGAECIKFQCHIPEEEMIKNSITPINADETIWNMMKRCALTEEEDKKLKEYTESLGMIYLCTPFSKSAVDRLERLNVKAYKIGSGECNNYPLVEYIAKKGKPVILSTGMNNMKSIRKSVIILEKEKIDYALLHCTSMYPTPYDKVRLGALTELQTEFPGVPVGLSDHSIGNYACFAAVALGACIIEKHFTRYKHWKGPDISISVDPFELRHLINGCNAIYEALGGKKDILKEEQPTIDFAYACVVSIKNIKKGDVFTEDNIWVKRPGTGEIKAESYGKILERKAKENIVKDTQLKWSQVGEN